MQRLVILFFCFNIFLCSSAQFGKVGAYFSTAQTALQFSFETSNWQNPSTISVLDTVGRISSVTEQIANPRFSEEMVDWVSEGVVTKEFSECLDDNATVIRIGPTQDENQNLRQENKIKQQFVPSADYVAIEYCLLSWESAPLFDEPSFQVMLDDQVVWEDAIRPESTNPTESGWRLAVIPLAQYDQSREHLLTIQAGNTVDLAGPTVAFVRFVSTSVWNLRSHPQMHINTQDLTVVTKYDGYQSLINIQSPHIFTSEQIPVGYGIFSGFEVGQTQDEPLFTVVVLHPLPLTEKPELIAKLSPDKSSSTLFFKVPASENYTKIAKYQVLRRVGSSTAIPVSITQYSMFWNSPRLSGSQEYITVPYVVGSEYRLQVSDLAGNTIESDWVQAN